MSPIPRDDTLPCRHSLPFEEIETAKTMLTNLPDQAPDVLVRAGIDPTHWPMVLRAAIESMRGTNSATSGDKRRFIESVLTYGRDEGHWREWSFVGTENRQDYRVELPDGTAVCIEAKGCPDGNNTTIWERPNWADEFWIWSLCPESLMHNPGQGVWSGIATRLMPKITAERTIVDAMIFWDQRCGTDMRRCPKSYGVTGGLRAAATDIPSQQDKADWVPPPCIYLFPRQVANARNNTEPPMHTRHTAQFADAMLAAFNVPEADRDRYLHDARLEVRADGATTKMQVEVVSRCWPDELPRSVVGTWKTLRRES